jgi:ubiquinone/menaquinone biosynthesis C-methylase UbiE
LEHHETVLDVGCGCGRMAIPLTAYLNKNGYYEGFDIDKKCIKWCSENITSNYSNFHFQHADVKNKFFNPDGKIDPEIFAFPYDSDSFDFVFLSSVFTHLLPHHMEHYFSEISRVLKKDGRCFITFFLINPESADMITQKKTFIDFFEINEGIYSTDKGVPEKAIAYDENLIRKLYTIHGLSVKIPFYYGSWCGRKRSIDFQDVVIATK